ncbi:MAG: response regulator [Pseudomonadota bacterium]
MSASHILVAEDDRSFREFVVELLRRWGYSVSTAADGSSALEQCETERPELIITDIVMPNTDGFELVSRLRTDHPELKIIACTGADAGSVYLKVADALGVNAVLQKPFEADELKLKIESMLSNA